MIVDWSNDIAERLSTVLAGLRDEAADRVHETRVLGHWLGQLAECHLVHEAAWAPGRWVDDIVVRDLKHEAVPVEVAGALFWGLEGRPEDAHFWGPVGAKLWLDSEGALEIYELWALRADEPGGRPNQRIGHLPMPDDDGWLFHWRARSSATGPGDRSA